MYAGQVFNLNCNEHGRVPVFFLNSNDAFHASVMVLVDTGASLSVVSFRWAKLCGYTIVGAPPISLRTACGTYVSSDKAVSLSFCVGGKSFTFLFRVLHELHDEVLLGRDFLAKYDVGVRCGAGRTSTNIVQTLSAEPTLGSLARCDVPRHEVPTPNCVSDVVQVLYRELCPVEASSQQASGGNETPECLKEEYGDGVVVPLTHKLSRLIGSITREMCDNVRVVEGVGFE